MSDADLSARSKTSRLQKARKGGLSPNDAVLSDEDDLENLSTGEVNIKPPKSFSERGFYDYITKLCDSGKQELAAKYYVDNAVELLKSNINLKEKFNHLIYLPRIIQAGAGTKHGYQKLLRKAAGVEAALKGVKVPPKGAFVDLGCGAHDPLSLATYYFLNGFEPCFGVDLLPPRNECYSALSMYDLLVNARSFPRRYCREGTEPGALLKRLGEFSVGVFERGNFWGGFGKISERLRFDAVDIAKAPIELNSASLIVSFAVLEHVTDINGVCQRLFDLLQPGGVVFHFVDLADHRAYRGDRKFGPLSFLADEDAPANMNRLRASEIVAAHKAVGFEILNDHRGTVEMPDEIRRNLHSRFKGMEIEDLCAIKLQLLVRRPN